jgi:hypothetical protein
MHSFLPTSQLYPDRAVTLNFDASCRSYTGPCLIQCQPQCRLLVPSNWQLGSPIHSPLLGDKVGCSIGLSYWPWPAHVAWRAGSTTICHCQLYPPSQGLWIGPQGYAGPAGAGILNFLISNFVIAAYLYNIRILKPEIKTISGSTVSAEGHLHRLLVRLPEAVEGGAPTQLLQLQVYGLPMDQISIKAPNPKCRLYCCLIEFIGWRYTVQSVMVVFSTPLVN